MKVIIIGAGMYVTGRDNTGPGTILASLAQLSKINLITEVCIVATKDSNEAVVEKESKRINSTLNSNLKVYYKKISTIDIFNSWIDSNSFDAGIVCVPDHLHYLYTESLLKKDIHTLVVKPLTPTYEEARKLCELQKSGNCYAAVEFHKRWDETNLYTKKIITEKRLGKLLYITVDYSQKISIPLDTFKSWSDKTNIFQYLGVHYVDLIYYLTNYKPIKLNAVGTNGILKEKGINTYDSVHANIIWSDNDHNELISILSINWIDPTCTSAMSDQKYKVIGTEGRIEVDQKNRGLDFVSEKGKIQAPNPYFSEFLVDINNENILNGYGFKSIAQFFYDINELNLGKTSIQKLEESDRPTFNRSLVSNAIIDAVNRSLNANSKWIEINEITGS